MIDVHKPHKKFIIRIISIILIICFLTTNTPAYGFDGQTLFKKTSHAQRYVNEETKEAETGLALTPLDLSVSQKHGRVLETYKGSQQKLIVHIQDRHADACAQFNIAGIIDNLAQKHNLHLLCLEGASGELDTSFYDKFPDTERKKQVAQAFVKTALFTGAEFYKITNRDKYLVPTGVEDRGLYLEHLDCNKKYQLNKQDVISFAALLRSDLNRLKAEAYAKDMLALDRANDDYSNKTITLSEYAQQLEKYSNKAKTDLTKYKNLQAFIALVEKEKAIDFNKAQEQREALIKELSETLEKDKLQELLSKSLEFKLGKITDEEFYSYLAGLAESPGHQVTKSPANKPTAHSPQPTMIYSPTSTTLRSPSASTTLRFSKKSKQRKRKCLPPFLKTTPSASLLNSQKQ
ncbi:MAG: hypothetical protein V2A72_07905 [Candidatus Omnitrophota bacterium]